MSATLQVHFRFVTALIDEAPLKLIAFAGVLHCDKVSWFGHIAAPAIRFPSLGFDRFGRQWFELRQ